jgi:hypothetical protein
MLETLLRDNSLSTMVQYSDTAVHIPYTPYSEYSIQSQALDSHLDEKTTVIRVHIRW